MVLAGTISDEYKTELINRIDAFGIKGSAFRFTGRLDNDTLFKYISASDITFALYSSKVLNNRMASPNKIFDALHAETFVISSDSFLCRKVIKENKIGVTVSNITAELLYQALIETIELSKHNNNNNYFTRDLKKEYSWESEFNRVKPLLFSELIT